MPLWHYIAGYAVMLAAMFAIVLMIYSSCMTVIHDAEEEAKEEAEYQAEILAEQKYQEMLASTKYRVRFGLRVVDATQNHERGGRGVNGHPDPDRTDPDRATRVLSAYPN